MAWSKQSEFEKGSERTWKLPSASQWRTYSKEPSELQVNPEDITEKPLEIQADEQDWNVQTEVSD